MTVIIIKDGIMASDSLVTQGDIRLGSTIKLHDLGDFVVGAAGSVSDIAAFILWLRDGSPEDKKPALTKDSDGFTALIYRRSTKTVHYADESYVLSPIYATEHAIGSGGEVARGALCMGATAREAVKAAIKHVVTCGGAVKTIKLDK